MVVLWVSCTSVAIQWHIWLHLGLSREGASGSVRAIVSWMPEFSRLIWFLFVPGEDEEDEEEKGTVSRKCTTGSFLAFLGLMVLPRSAAAFFQVAFRVRRGTGRCQFGNFGYMGAVVLYDHALSHLPKGSRMEGIMFAFSSL